MAAHTRIFNIGGVAATLLALAWPIGAMAQANPSSNDIINSLRPSAGFLGRTRGIRPVGPASVGEPAPASGSSQISHAAVHTRSAHAAPAGKAAETTAGAPSVNLNVQFANGSAELTPAAAHTLDQLGTALSSAALASYKFRIEGHTDTVGGAAANKTLSDDRAAKVVDYLASKFNIDRARLQAVGMGEQGLLVHTGPNTPEPRNRRVQVVNVGA